MRSQLSFYHRLGLAGSMQQWTWFQCAVLLAAKMVAVVVLTRSRRRTDANAAGDIACNCSRSLIWLSWPTGGLMMMDGK